MSNQSPPRPPRSMTDEILDGVLRLVAAWRVELFLLALPVGFGLWLYAKLGTFAAVAIPTMLVAATLASGTPRKRIGRALHRASVRRRLDSSLSSVPGLLSERPPIVGKVARTNGGDRVILGLRPGTSVDDLVKAQAVIAASLGVREVRAVADASTKNKVTLTIIRRDPFASLSLPAPTVDLRPTCAWEPIPVGLDEEGEPVVITLPERNLLIGGEPGAGKSVGLSVLVASFALDPDVVLWLFDGKLVELAPWADCARRFVGPDIELAISVLEELRVELERRFADLLERKVKKVVSGDGLALHVLVIDELAVYVAGVDKKLASRFAELLRDLVARGRAAGIIVIAATQKPAIEIVPSALRDLFGFRWAFRCATKDASDTVLGSGWASGGFSAADIDAATRGVGLLLHEGGTPIRLRAFFLTDDDVAAISRHAGRLRQGPRGGEQW